MHGFAGSSRSASVRQRGMDSDHGFGAGGIPVRRSSISPISSRRTQKRDYNNHQSFKGAGDEY